MRRTLTLTSPLSRGPLVEETQRLLAIPVTGVYGPDTAKAVRAAKWHLGYPEQYVNGDAGDKLRLYLGDKSKLPLLYKRRARKRAEVARRLGPRVLAEARKHLGYKESPRGSNLQKFGVWYGINGWPWCAQFVSYCLAKCGFKGVNPRERRWAYCPYVLADAKAGRYGLHIARWGDVGRQLARGDCIVVLYDWDNDGVADHIGFVEEITGTSRFRAIEGNTSFGDNSNGGEVMRRDRHLSDVIAFVGITA